MFSTLLDYFSGLKIANAESKLNKKVWLVISVGINLGFLGFFKYYNFFIDSFSALLESFGFQAHYETLAIILPVGISFYTFHGLSYVFDIYNQKITPTTNWVDYTLFVSFFPLLVAGPIERATHLLPQIQKPRVFKYDKAVDGLKQLLWGLLKKVVIADGCAEYANLIFNNHQDYSGSTLLMGAIFFAFQIYGDFSGYSDMALGTARMLGFELLQNFRYPYFSRDVAEFWRRWHISLSSWFKDYLYFPLGGSKGSLAKTVTNTFIIFIVSGFWHGAALTFIFWGALNALFIMPSILFKSNRRNLEIVAKGRSLPTIKEFLSMVGTFLLVTLAWIFFRAESMNHAFDFIAGIFTPELFRMPSLSLFSKEIYYILLLLPLFVATEWIGREYSYAIENLKNVHWRPLRWFAYFGIAFAILMFMQTSETPFIYFQF
ncbi:MBOAT family O-acyltransferase [Dyadobacter fanqingshengii]|uniref:MBOAT family O-acyltransferase n=1 Tax=Dyadobacter fanqingshengii TaxID=2906443 RepID=UPI002714D6AE|nr:MBOAT family O-acyltransferase [Dyadobacter fanqingshengii]